MRSTAPLTHVLSYMKVTVDGAKNYVQIKYLQETGQHAIILVDKQNYTELSLIITIINYLSINTELKIKINIISVSNRKYFITKYHQ